VPEVVHVPSWPYIALGIAYAALAVGMLVVGARRQRDLQGALDRDVPAPLSFGVVMVFTIGGIALASTTVVLVVAQT
jgi:putative membrane protein